VTAALLAVVGATAALAAGPGVVDGDRSVAGLGVGHATPAAATARFGAASATRADGGVSCGMEWSRLGLAVTFLDFEGRACSKGVLVGATVTQRSGWRTNLGLRVGDSTARLRALYPGATLRSGEPGRNGFWLVVRRTCREVGAAPYPGLLARMRAGRVSALVVAAGVCE
jgi:hypothetical protein